MARTTSILTQAEVEAVEYLASLGNSLAVVTNASGLVVSSSATATEVGYLSGVTSAIQTQLNAKPDLSDNNTWTGTNIFTLKVAIGDNDAMTINGSATTSMLAVHVDDGAAEQNIELHRHSTNAIGPILYGAKSRGTGASPTIVADNDSLLSIYAVGYDGTDYATAGAIHCYVDDTPGSDDMPGRWEFQVSPNGSQTLATALTIGNDLGATFTGSITLTTTTSIINTGTTDSSDTKAITLAGGGAYGPTRGSGVAVIGNEYAAIGGDLELMAGDSAVSGMIKFYVGDGAGSATLAASIARSTKTATFYGHVDATQTCTVASTLTVGAQATATSVGIEIGNYSGGTPFIDFKSSSIDYDVRIINSASNSLSFIGGSAGYFFDATVNSIYSIVATTSNATLTTITQGITIAGNLITSAYVNNGYTAGLTWSSTDDNASKPKGGIFLQTTASGTVMTFGTSNAYVTGITSYINMYEDGRLYVGPSSTTSNGLSVVADSLTTGNAIYVYSNSSNASARSVASITNAHASATSASVLTLTQNAAGPYNLYLNSTANGQTIHIDSAATTADTYSCTSNSLTTGGMAVFYSNSSSASTRNLVQIYNVHASATAVTPLLIDNSAVVSTNFKRGIKVNGFTIWTSNGNTPNGALSGTAGDVCVGCDSSKSYYCTGTTSWTAM